ncbi:MAG: helix-turn-helix domain-containing protein [Candidatus ainarchaeum sp.]|nr:helix-turn-helix domain-containing protein [Candidatus ainarchaeum sp.]
MAKKENILTIVIGRKMDRDLDELFSGKPLDQIKQSKNMLYLDNYAQLAELLSPARINVLRYLIGNQDEKNPKSVSQTAKSLGRHQEAVSRDIAHLKKLGLVETKKSKQATIALPKYAEIQIKIK